MMGQLTHEQLMMLADRILQVSLNQINEGSKYRNRELIQMACLLKYNVEFYKHGLEQRLPLAWHKYLRLLEQERIEHDPGQY